jgi:hypothetical protein
MSALRQPCRRSQWTAAVAIIRTAGAANGIAANHGRVKLA